MFIIYLFTDIHYIQIEQSLFIGQNAWWTGKLCLRNVSSSHMSQFKKRELNS